MEPSSAALQLLLRSALPQQSCQPQQERNVSAMPYTTAPQTLTETQKAEAVAHIVGIPFESTNKYKGHLMPPNKVVKNQPEHPTTGRPLPQSSTTFSLRTRKASASCIFMMFLGCGNLRSLQMHIAVRSSTGNTHKREDFSLYFGRCMPTCCLATAYTDIERALPNGTYEKKYSLTGPSSFSVSSQQSRHRRPLLSAATTKARDKGDGKEHRGSSPGRRSSTSSERHLRDPRLFTAMT